MSFQEFIQKSWGRHDKESEAVATELLERESELDSVDKLASWLPLLFHTTVGHLGDFQRIQPVLEKLFESDLCKDHEGAKRMVARLLCALTFCQGGDTEKWLKIAADGESTSHGAKVRSLSLAAANLAVAGQLERAMEAYNIVCEAMPNELSKDDPSVQSMAVTSNNIACDLEEKESRSELETELMLKAAVAARKYWEVAGTWIQVERAEYRLSQSYMKAGNFAKAFEHAALCLQICQKNEADAMELFFAHEAHVKIHKARCAELRLQVPEDQRSWCPEL